LIVDDELDLPKRLPIKTQKTIKRGQLK
jgi:hypothetical protein